MIIMQRMEHGRFADIRRRQSITRNEFLEFFEGSKIINKLDNTKDLGVDRRSDSVYDTARSAWLGA